MTLHVGPGTFRPVRAERLADHRVEAERYEVPVATAAAIDRARERGGRVVAVGTTTVRALETAAAAGQAAWCRAPAGPISRSCPATAFRAVDALLTNFHLPRSSLLLLVAAFAGRERVLGGLSPTRSTAGYRFYSYGDAMLLGSDFDF